MTSTRRQQIVASLCDPEYRRAFVDEEISTGLAFQIRAMREGRGWSQQELGSRAEAGGPIAQETICKFENPDYGRYSLTSLKRLAAAFDVALMVRFVPFSRLVDLTAWPSPGDLNVPSFAEDERLGGPRVADVTVVATGGEQSTDSVTWAAQIDRPLSANSEPIDRTTIGAQYDRTA